MSEGKYTGEKNFKEKWDNYWYYYKLHTWIGIFVLFILTFTITQCIHTVKPDVTIDLVTTGAVTEIFPEVDGYLSEVITDSNEDGNKHISLNTLYISNEAISEQNIAMQQKMMLELAAGDVSMFIFDKTNLERYITQDAYSPLSDFIDLAPYKNTENKLVEHNGIAYAISLKGSAKLAEMGFLSDDLYAAFRFVPEEFVNDEKKMAEYRNAASILEELLK